MIKFECLLQLTYYKWYFITKSLFCYEAYSLRRHSESRTLYPMICYNTTYHYTPMHSIVQLGPEAFVRKKLLNGIFIFPFYLLPRPSGFSGMSELCLREVDIDLTRMGKLSLSKSSTQISSKLSADSIFSP